MAALQPWCGAQLAASSPQPWPVSGGATWRTCPQYKSRALYMTLSDPPGLHKAPWPGSSVAAQQRASYLCGTPGGKSKKKSAKKKLACDYSGRPSPRPGFCWAAQLALQAKSALRKAAASSSTMVQTLRLALSVNGFWCLIAGRTKPSVPCVA